MIPSYLHLLARIQFFVDRNKLNHMTIFKIPFSGHKTLVKLGARFEDDKQDVRQDFPIISKYVVNMYTCYICRAM